MKFLKLVARCGAIVFFLSSTGVALAQPVESGPALLDRMTEVDIPAQPLAEGLIELSKQSGVQIFMATSAVRGRGAPAVQGEMTLGAALTRLIADAPLVFRVAGNNTIGIDRAPGFEESNAEDLDALLAPTIKLEEPKTSPPEPTPEPAEESRRPERVIDEIIVTATKREVSVREIAASVTALIGDQLETAGVQDIDDIVDAVPGVNIVDSDAGIAEGKRITIRGIAAGANQNDTVGVFIDETSFTDVFRSIATADANPFDMASVEVLKGPVGTLFGGSALNGAIRYIPQQPVMGEWQAKAFTQFTTLSESEEMGHVSGLAVNVPLMDSLALRLVGNDRKSAGWVDSENQTYQAKDVNEVTQRSLRAILRWEFSESLDMSLMYVDQNTLAHDVGYSDFCCGGGYERSASPRPSPSEIAYELWQLKSTWAFDWADLVYVASLSDKRADAIFDASNLAEADPAVSTVLTTASSRGKPQSHELRLVSAPGGDWDWLAGIYSYDYNVFTDSVIATGENPESVPLVPFEVFADVTEQAAFGEVNWRFLEGFELSVGLRLYEFSYDGQFATTGPYCVITDPLCILSGFEAPVVIDSEEGGANPRLSLKWEISEDAMTFATVARGFRFGGLNNAVHPEIPTVYKSDALWSYEWGARAQWFNKTLTTDATVFAIDWTDAQFQTATSDGLNTYTDNVGAVEGRGVEGQIIWDTPLRGLSLALTAAYAKIETAEDFERPNATGSTVVAAGTPWPRAPDWQTTAAINWEGELFGWPVGASVTHAHFGEAVQGFSSTDRTTKIFGYATYALQFTLNKGQESLWPELALNVNNLTNTQGVLYVAPTPATITTSYTKPRSISLRASFNF